MTDADKQKPATQSPDVTNRMSIILKVLAILYLFVIFDFSFALPPYSRPSSSEVKYQAFGLVLSLSFLLLVDMLRRKQNCSPVKMWSECPSEVRGIVLLACSGVMKGSFVLLLLFPFPDNTAAQIGFMIIETMIVASRWVGVTLFLLGAFRLLRGKLTPGRLGRIRLVLLIALGLLFGLLLIVCAGTLFEEVRGIASRLQR
jgi:hypothetical protein